MKRFALLGAAGYVAQRHLKAISEVDGTLIAACDPHDSVGILDRYFPDCRYFPEIERFDRFLEKQRRQGEGIDFLSVATPNYLHDAHCRLGLRLGASVICEKPLVISPWNLDQLAQIESECPGRINTVLQLRVHKAVQALKAELTAHPPQGRVDVDLAYITRRGPWYHQSWKGNDEKSGSLAMNIGVHFFDLLLWLFGPLESLAVQVRTPDHLQGTLQLARANVRWKLSIRAQDLPPEAQGRPAWRQLTLNGQPFDFSTGFEDLHTVVYRDIIEGRGFGIEDARPAIELVHQIRNAPLSE